MKRYGNLFHEIVDSENIHLAIENAAKGKISTYSIDDTEALKEMREVVTSPDKYVKILQELLLTKSFVCSEYTVFDKQDKGKIRQIYKLPFFPDRVLQHAILQVLEPIWRKTLIAHTFQSIQGRGVHLCLKHVKKAVQVDKMNYCLQIDVKKFYPSINNEILKKVVRKKIKCKETLWLLDTIIDGMEGVPIGNYISQYFANLYLSELDHHIKEVLRHKYYYRYCDDLIILDTSKERLHSTLTTLNLELEKILLSVKGNYQIYEINEVRGVNCFGYTVHPSRVKIRTSIARNFERKLRLMRKLGYFNTDSIGSYFGWFKHCDGANLWAKITDNLWDKNSHEQRILNRYKNVLYSIRAKRSRASANRKLAESNSS